MTRDLNNQQTVLLGEWLVSFASCTVRLQDTHERAPKEVKITPRSMEVLKLLCERPGDVVSTSELIEALWQPVSGTDHYVHKAIGELRNALGDKPGKPRYIKTIPKRGYALIAPIALPDDSQATQDAVVHGEGYAESVIGGYSKPRSPRYIQIGFVCLLAAAAFFLSFFSRQDGAIDTTRAEERVTLAVLPFLTRDYNDENQFIAQGIRDALFHGLSKLSHLQVLSGARYSSQYNDVLEQQSLSADISNASHVLLGSVFSGDGRLRVIVQLVRTSDGLQRYADQFDLEFNDIFMVQDEIASNIVSALRIHLDDNEREEMLDWGTTNALAYESFLKAEFYYNQFNPRDFRQAISLFRQATELDPGFLNAYHGLAAAANNLAVYSGADTISEMYDLVLEMHREISRVAPESEFINSINAIKLRMQGKSHIQQERELRSYILSGQAPDFALAHYALLLIGARMYDEAYRLLDLAVENSPYKISPDEVWNYRHSVETPPAIVSNRKRQLQTRPYHIGFLGAVAINLAFLGDLRQAELYLEQQRRVDVEGIMYHHSKMIFDFLGGRYQVDSPELQEALIDNPDFYYNNGALSFMLGDIEKGIYYWDQLQPSHNRRLFNVLHVSEKFFPDQVRNAERYHDLLERLGNGKSWQRTLMEGIQEMSSVTGVHLHPRTLQAYQSNTLMVDNNLWSEADWQEFDLHKSQRLGYQGVLR